MSGDVERPASLALPRWWWLALAAGWLAARLATGFDGLAGQDPYAYLGYATSLRETLLGGPPPGPFFWPVGYPVAGAVLALTGLPVAVALQLVSGMAWLAAAATGLAMVGWTRGAGEAGGGLGWLLGFALAPYVVRSSLMVMSDALAVAAVLGSLACAARWLDGGQDRFLAAAGALAGCAVAVRWAVAPVLAPSVVVLVARSIARRRFAALGLAALAVAVSFIPQLVVGMPAGMDSDHPFVAGWSPLNAFRFELVSGEGRQHVTVPHGVAVPLAPVHPGFFAIGLLAVPWLRRQDLAGAAPKLALAGFVAGSLFLLGLPVSNPRFELPVAPLGVLLLAPAWGRLLGAAGARARWVPWMLLVGAAIAQLGLGWRALAGVVTLDRLERGVVACLEEQPPTTLHTFSFTPALEALGTPHRLVELWSADPEPAKPGDLLLFAPDRLRPQWADHRLFANWTSIGDRFQLEPVRTFDGGWTLWRVGGERRQGGPEGPSS